MAPRWPCGTTQTSRCSARTRHRLAAPSVARSRSSTTGPNAPTLPSVAMNDNGDAQAVWQQFDTGSGKTPDRGDVGARRHVRRDDRDRVADERQTRATPRSRWTAPAMRSPAWAGSTPQIQRRPARLRSGVRDRHAGRRLGERWRGKRSVGGDRRRGRRHRRVAALERHERHRRRRTATTPAHRSRTFTSPARRTPAMR